MFTTLYLHFKHPYRTNFGKKSKSGPDVGHVVTLQKNSKIAIFAANLLVPLIWITNDTIR